MEKDNGGPAFPGQVQTSVQAVAGIHGYGASHDVPDRTFPVYSPTPGMTLRDWFAGMADMSEMKVGDLESAVEFVGSPIPEDFAGQIIWQADLVAKTRYAFADAMLAERNRKE